MFQQTTQRRDLTSGVIKMKPLDTGGQKNSILTRYPRLVDSQRSVCIGVLVSFVLFHCGQSAILVKSHEETMGGEESLDVEVGVEVVIDGRHDLIHQIFNDCGLDQGGHEIDVLAVPAM